MRNELHRRLRPVGREPTRVIWTASADRNAVTRAADRIDQLLGTDPSGVGESRADRFRVLIELPLTAYYEVHEPDRRVRVLGVVGR